jgi:hypothetical protein
MEYVSGPSLREVLDQADGGNGIGEDQALYFMRELIKGMRYLHDAGVVHRDLKPHNIFFEDGTVKIGDYSLSKAISGTQQTGHTTTVGSVHYMAPEIGEGKYDKAVDIYALGVILFEMLTGNPPYVGESMTEVLIKHLTNEPDVSGLSEPFASAIKKAMRRDPADRFQSADDFLIALCPSDHSSYLPPPSSLTMIGDRAVAKRLSENRGKNLGAPAATFQDTFIGSPALVDTKDSFDSQPFERPGFFPGKTPGKNGLAFLSLVGLWWQPSQQTTYAADSVSLIQRAVTAVAVCWVFCIFMVGAELIPANQAIALALLLPVMGAMCTWLFLQCLPRSQTIAWTIVGRIMSGVIILVFGIAGLMCGYLIFDDDTLAVAVANLMFVGLLIEWRAFITADRYPRVGLLRTSFAVCSVMAFPLFFGVNETFITNIVGMTAVFVITIQLLAPQTKMPIHSVTDEIEGTNAIQSEPIIELTRADIDVPASQQKVSP